MKFIKSVFSKAKPHQPAVHSWYSSAWLPLIIERHGSVVFSELPGFQIGINGTIYPTLSEAKAHIRKISAIEGF